MPRPIYEAIIAHARFCRPEEACGLLAADNEGRLCFSYSLTNAQASPTRYTLDPTEHFRALKHAEAQGWSLAGVFHSHPDTPAFPSATDVQLALEPEWLYVIVSLADPVTPEVRAYWITDGQVTEESIDVEG
ncbi:MAG: M67 family metallopeptidase [Acidimicrobiia bacterium]